MKKYNLKSNSLYTIYRAFSLDLLFFMTYYSIFFMDEKNFSQSDLSSIILVSSLFYIVLEPLLVKVIQKLGNTKSMRAGGLLWIVGLTMMAFGPNKITVFAGDIIYQIAFLLKAVEPIILRNNLKLENREEDFSKTEGTAYSLYSILTAVIMLITGFMYDYNPYSIVYACYVFLIFDIVLSFIIKDEQEYNAQTQKQVKNLNEKTKKSVFTGFVLLICLSSFLYSGVIGNVFGSFSVLIKETNIIKNNSGITFIIFFGRISRIIAAGLYSTLYKKLKNKILVIFPVLLFVFLSLVFIVGQFITDDTAKISIYIALLVIVYTMRDPFILYIQDTIFNYININERRDVISINLLFYKLGSVVTSFVCWFVLKEFNQRQYIAFGAMALLIFVTIIFAVILFYKLKSIDKKNLQNE